MSFVTKQLISTDIWSQGGVPQTESIPTHVEKSHKGKTTISNDIFHKCRDTATVRYQMSYLLAAKVVLFKHSLCI